MCLCNHFDKYFDDDVDHLNYFYYNLSILKLFIGLDVAQQREHDRKVAEAAVAAARIEWERQHLQSQPSKQIQTQFIPAAAPTTIIHSGKLNKLT